MSYVYFIEAAEIAMVKIGWSAEPRRRLEALQQASPVALRLVALVDGPVARERELHDRFAGDRVRGEWFRFSSSISAFVVEMRDRGLVVSDPTPRYTTIRVKASQVQRLGRVAKMLSGSSYANGSRATVCHAVQYLLEVAARHDDDVRGTGALAERELATVASPTRKARR